MLQSLSQNMKPDWRRALALLLALLYALFNDTIMPTVTQKIKDMFNYAGSLS